MGKNILILVLLIIVLVFIFNELYKKPNTKTPPISNGSPCITKKNGVDVDGTLRNCESICICIPN